MENEKEVMTDISMVEKEDKELHLMHENNIDMVIVPARHVRALIAGINEYLLYVDGVREPFRISGESAKEVEFK
jgi:hypothetical protein